VIEPPHHRLPPQRIASEQRNHGLPKSSKSFATKSATTGLMRRSKQQCSFDHLVGDGEYLWGRHLDAESELRLLLARIIGWVDVIDASRTDELNLDNPLLISGPGVVSVLCRIHPQRARL
jgi:hypothetical protein